MVAPVTGLSGPTSTGTDSPVTSEASTAEEPSTTTPSVAIFSPGRTTITSPSGQLVGRDLLSSVRRAGRWHPWRPGSAGP